MVHVRAREPNKEGTEREHYCTEPRNCRIVAQKPLRTECREQHRDSHQNRTNENGHTEQESQREQKHMPGRVLRYPAVGSNQGILELPEFGEAVSWTAEVARRDEARVQHLNHGIY